MAFTKVIGFGGKLEVDRNYPLTADWTDVGQVVDFGCNVDIAEEDVTHQQSAVMAPFWKDFISGAVAIELTFNCIFDPGQNEHEDTLLDQVGVIRQFRYTFTDGTIWEFPGFYRTIGTAVPMENALNADVTIRVTGTPDWAAVP